MSQGEKFRYFLRHAWFWPIVFMMRPLVVEKRATDSQLELMCAIWSGIFLGGLIGIGGWFLTGEITSIPITAFAMAVTITFTIAFTIAFTIDNIPVIAIVGLVAVAVAVDGAVARASAVILTLFYSIGIFLGIGYPDLSQAFLIWPAIAVFLTIIAIWRYESKSIEASNWLMMSFIISGLLFLPIAGFTTFPSITKAELPAWAGTLPIALFLGATLGFFLAENGVQAALTQHTVHPNAQAKWLGLLWLLFPTLAFVAWFPDPITPGLDANLEVLALSLLLGLLVLTGFVFWPLMAIITFWQCRSKHTASAIQKTLPFFWQTFAYPLPGLVAYYQRLYHHTDANTTIKAIQHLQQNTLQTRAGSQAAIQLATHSTSTLNFCGQLALQSNHNTLQQLHTVTPLVRVLVALSQPQEKESEQPLYLYIAAKRSHTILTLFQKDKSEPIAPWDDIRTQTLSQRISWIKRQTLGLPSQDELAFFALLDTLDTYAKVTQLRQFETIVPPPTPSNMPFLQTGEHMRQHVEAALSGLADYRDMSSPEARRELLRHLEKSLKAIDWGDIPMYWADIGRELTQQWCHLIQQEIEHVREWLNLEVTLPEQRWNLGRQTLRLIISNPSGVMAKAVQLNVIPQAQMDWHHNEVHLPLLEGQSTLPTSLDFTAKALGDYRITGTLSAKDLDGNPFQSPFAFQISVQKAGMDYQIPEIEPYVVGEGVGDANKFIGRTVLLHQLRSRWRQPQGKPATVLIGQRRIGKTSLLKQIVRQGLSDTNLIPILLDITSVTGDYDFLTLLTRKMAEAINTPAPILNSTSPYASFKTFLLDLKPRLHQRRFLVMLDEADRIPARQLGDQLPEFLRALMQGEDFPLLLLFCGTYALARMGRDYHSILFNTAQVYYVSYLTQAESAQLLTQPAEGILQYDPLALSNAYELTRGHPLVLQSLGATLIAQFNEKIFDGETRSAYVTPHDLQLAVDKHIQQGANLAFENHWQDNPEPHCHQLLSGMAWALTDKPQTDINGIESALNKLGLTVPRKILFDLLEQLVDEEILTREGPTYRFTVPLYRAWLAWRWPPERVREATSYE